MHPFESREQVLTATWTPHGGVHVTSSDLPGSWLVGLERLGQDLRVRHYGGDIKHVEWVAMYNPDGGAVWLWSSVKVAGRDAGELGGNGTGAHIDADVEEALASMADLLQTRVAEVGTAWPWGDTGGFMSPQLIEHVAVWVDRNGQTTRIGDLAESS